MGNVRGASRGLAVLVLTFLLVAAAFAAVPQAAYAGTGGDTDNSGLTAGETVVDPSGESADKQEKKAAKPKLNYRSKSAGSKVEAWKKGGAVSGKKGKAVRMLSAKLDADGLAGTLEYRVYSKGAGWSKWKAKGAFAGKGNKDAYGMAVRLKGGISKSFDVTYRVYNGKGWRPWVVNGASSGSRGKGGAVERLQIKLVAKKSSPKLDDGTYFITLAKSSRSALSAPDVKHANNKQMVRGSFDSEAQGQRFYLRNESDGTVTLQSVLSGKFLCASKGKVVQRNYSASSKAFRWTVSWNAGLRFENAKTHTYLALVGSKAVAGKVNNRWSVTPTSLIADGTYAFTNQAKGNVLAVKDSSVKSGTPLVVEKSKKVGFEVFEVTQVKSDVYNITSAPSGKNVAVTRASKAVNPVKIGKANKRAAQKWEVSLTRAGNFEFKNQASGNVLTALKGGKDGAMVKASAGKGKATQRWTIKPAEYSLTGDYALDARIYGILESHTTLRSCFSYVVGFGYRSGSKYGKAIFSDSTTVDMARDMLDHHSGNCYRFAALFSWLARGLGYDTNVRAGYVPSASGGWAPHGWVEIYQGGTTRICDPDLAHELPGHNWYMTTYGGAPVSYSR